MEIDKIEAGPEPKEAETAEDVEVAEVEVRDSPGVLAILMGLQIKPAQSIGNLARGRGYVLTVIAVLGVTLKALVPSTTGMWPVLK